jgi:hypothetical protein
MKYTSLAATFCMAVFTAVAVDGTSSANARHSRSSEDGVSQSRVVGAPLLAVIALAQQRISIYSGSGKIMEGPVSTGARGHETPAGIYTILEKEEDHHSNLYDDASMPYMERLTWTGISMHAGPLPGYPASHGCTRLSYGFAQRLYQATKSGMRVVIVREDIAPAEIEQPELFDNLAWAPSPASSSSEAEMHARLAAIKEAKLAKAEAAKKRESEARSAAARKAAEAAPAVRIVQAAAVKLARMEAGLAAGERMRETVSKRTENGAAWSAAAARVQAMRLQFEKVKAEAQAKMDAAAKAEEEAKLAAAASDEAAEEAETARQNAWPISIFISRQAQRLYIRRGREPVYEGPVTIRDPDKPIGSFVFTALGHTGTPGRMRWNVVSLYKNATAVEPYSEATRDAKKRREPKPADVAGARNALQRLDIPQEALDHISGPLLPGSSLIVSDEAASSETGKDTDFIVFMSRDPKGGATFRKPALTHADSSGRRQSHGQQRRTHSSYSRSRPRTSGASWQSRGSSPFSSIFGF